MYLIRACRPPFSKEITEGRMRILWIVITICGVSDTCGLPSVVICVFDWSAFERRVLPWGCLMRRLWNLFLMMGWKTGLLNLLFEVCFAALALSASCLPCRRVLDHVESGTGILFTHFIGLEIKCCSSDSVEVDSSRAGWEYGLFDEYKLCSYLSISFGVSKFGGSSLSATVWNRLRKDTLGLCQSSQQLLLNKI